MNRILTNLAYFLVMSVIAVAISTLIGKVVQSSNTPQEDINALAYQHLVENAKSSDLRQIKAGADQVLQVTTDPELRAISTIISKQTEYFQAQGHQVAGEFSTLKGVMKSMMAGVQDPTLWLQGMGVAWDTFMADPEKLEQTLSSRYQPYFQQIQRAKVSGENASAYTFIGLCVVAILIRKPILNRIPLLKSTPTSQQTSRQTNEALVTCPSCGARNRNKLLSAGQKLVCGQCKTVLMSVS